MRRLLRLHRPTSGSTTVGGRRYADSPAPLREVGALHDGVLRAMFGSGLYMAGLGLFAAAVGLLVRHTAAALSVVLGPVFVVGTLVARPSAWGEWTAKLMPGNAGSGIAAPQSSNPLLLDPRVGFATFVAEVAAVLAVAAVVFSRRDA